MATIVTRSVGYVGSATLTAKGTPLTNTEVDNNFINLNNAKLETNGSGANLTGLNASNISSGTLAVARGGTGQTTYTNGELLIGNSTGNTLSKATLTAGNNIVVTNGFGVITLSVSNEPSFQAITATGNGLIAGDLAINGGDLTTTAATFNLVNANATTLNIGGAATALSVGAAGSTVTLNGTTASTTINTGALVVKGGVGINGATFIGTTLNVAGASTLTGATTVTGALTASTSIVTGLTTFPLLNTTATTINFGGAATALNMGAATGTTTINNATVTLANATTLNINGANPTVSSSSTGTLTLFNTNILTVNAFAAATSLTLNSTTANSTINIGTGATLSGSTKTINIGTVGVSGSTTNIALGSAVSGALGTLTVNSVNTQLKNVNISGTITQGTAVQAVPSGSAPLFSARAWAQFDATIAANKTGTVTRTLGSTTALITITNHGLLVGHVIYAATGIAAGIYDVVSVIDANNFTVTTAATTAIAAGTAIQLNFVTITASGNINSIAISTTGQFWFNFSTAMATTSYAIFGSGTGNSHLSMNPSANATPRRLLTVHAGIATSAAWVNNVGCSIVVLA